MALLAMLENTPLDLLCIEKKKRAKFSHKVKNLVLNISCKHKTLKWKKLQTLVTHFHKVIQLKLNEATQNEVSIVQSTVPHGTGRGTGEQNQQKNDLEFSQEWLLHFFSVNEAEKPFGLLSRPGRNWTQIARVLWAKCRCIRDYSANLFP